MVALRLLLGLAGALLAMSLVHLTLWVLSLSGIEALGGGWVTDKAGTHHPLPWFGKYVFLFTLALPVLAARIASGVRSVVMGWIIAFSLVFLIFWKSSPLWNGTVHDIAEFVLPYFIFNMRPTLWTGLFSVFITILCVAGYGVADSFVIDLLETETNGQRHSGADLDDDLPEEIGEHLAEMRHGHHDEVQNQAPDVSHHV